MIFIGLQQCNEGSIQLVGLIPQQQDRLPWHSVIAFMEGSSTIGTSS
jgi:hypothetical protein